MDPATHIDHLRTNAAALLHTYQAAPEAPVLSCPGWTRTDLLAHVAGVHAWVRAQLAAGTGERVRLSTVQGPREGTDLAEWYEAGAAELVAALAGMDTTASWPTWAGPQPGTFYPRRMAQETAMHRWDAEPYGIDPSLAVDGVDEHLELFAPLIPADKLADAAGTIHLHATDVDGDAGEWLVRVGAGGIQFEHGHAKGDVALRGTAGDLLLWAWNRVPVDGRFEVFGDDALLRAWRQSVTI